MSHRKNYQVIKHDQDKPVTTAPVSPPTTAKVARKTADEKREQLPLGSSVWFTVEQTRRQNGK
jgi:hypothetical protein